MVGRVFTEPGTWCYFCDIWIDGNAGKSYRLSEDLVVKLNGIACKIDGVLIVDNDYSRVRVKLPEIDVKKQDTRTEITLVEATSADYATIAVVGASVKTLPTIQITNDAPVRFDTYMGGWFKKIGENSYSRVDDGIFTEGT